MSGTITRNQWIAISILALGLISGATGQMTDIFGAGAAKSIASAASFLSSFVAGVQIILGGQGQQIQDVRNIAANSSSASPDAKQALIAATISLPEVQTIVADKKTADAAPSESVVAADAVSVVPAT